ncbi:hypothetical protein HYH03_010930 [Edaphochlamys debaryana]|uniref:FK506-binding protein n=1 Tax=Edaphochlamys debaryana TaxID=47281 RepID=A0A835XY34_9CHLO|nr:hypothetical protein HYH03_010930 [Edaphochlamys debaryana]|eukprot:KAG2490536.1 hypothetical protein HYH03_010930 [Edaphochlamys debaryana]
MAFWGAVVKPGKPHAFVPPPEDWNLHLSQAALEPSVPEGKRVALAVKPDPQDDPIIVATLTAGRTDTAVLDMFFSQYAEFSVMGDYPLHLTGYFTPATHMDDDGEGDEGEDEDDDDYSLPMGHPALMGPHGDDDSDDEDEEGEDDDDLDDEDDEDEDEDEDDDIMDGDDDEEAFGFPGVGGRKKPHVVIEEIHDEPKAAAKGAGAQAKEQPKGKQAQANGSAKAAAAAVQDEEETEEREDTPPKKQKQKGKQAEAKQPAQQQAGSKRPAEGGQQPEVKKQATGQQQQPAKGKAEAKAEAKQPQQQTPKQEPKPAQQQTPKTAPPGKQAPKAEAEAPRTTGKKSIRTHPNGFTVEDVALGPPHAKLAKPGNKVGVRYTGRLKSNGKVFDKSTGKPFQFRLGVGEVIKGWDLGVEGMRVGDKRRLTIPPQLAYGTSGVKGTIPPNATLEFDVELVDVK